MTEPAKEGTALRNIRIEKLPQGTEFVLRILKTGTGRFRLRVTVERFRGSESVTFSESLISDGITRLRAIGRGPIIDAAVAELGRVRTELRADAERAVYMVDKVMTYADAALDLAIFAGDNLAAAAIKMLDAGAGKRL